MLDISIQTTLMDRFWKATPSKAELPTDQDEFFSRRGPTTACPMSDRGFQRYYFRGKAILQLGDVCHAVYTNDVSRTGIGLYSPVQLFPCDKVTLVLPTRDEVVLQVTRCRRVADRCYDCGSVFWKNSSENANKGN